MVSFTSADPAHAHKRSLPAVRERKQKLTCRLSDSGFEEELVPSTEPRSAQLTWYQQYGDTGLQIQKEKEEDFHPCHSLAHQPQVTAEARCKLVSWLLPVHQHLGLSFECSCLTVNILDRFLACTPVAADCFQLLGVTALLLASKQVEVFSPRVSSLLSLCCNIFTKDQLCNLECLILVRLKFRLCAPTVAFFLDCYANLTTENDTAKLRNRATVKLAQKLCELSLADYAFNKYPPSLTAKCALRIAGEVAREAVSPLVPDWDSFVDGKEGGSMCTEDWDSGCPMETTCLMQECVSNLRLLASLNHEALTVCGGSKKSA
ncbi:unnamed protein product [Knipowitschia caucasica]|uniref:G2/mitotic-specific cyclin-B2 n=1 Tax=Knipowitschia caucasica TaxID=637954 RepID=A0AAV2MP18_KNICA